MRQVARFSPREEANSASRVWPSVPQSRTPLPAHRRFCEREPCRTGTCSPHASGPLLPAAQGGTRAEMSDEAWCSFPASGALSAGEKQSQASCVCLRAGRTRRVSGGIEGETMFAGPAWLRPAIGHGVGLAGRGHSSGNPRCSIGSSWSRAPARPSLGNGEGRATVSAGTMEIGGRQRGAWWSRGSDSLSWAGSLS